MSLELGHSLEPLSEEAHNDVNKVRGCVSQVWLNASRGRTRKAEASYTTAATVTLTSCGA